MCQAYYNPRIMDILDQFIMGSANTPSNVQKIYQQLNLSMCSINTVEIPKACTSYIFWNVFEFCLRHYNMVVIGVYKRHDDSQVGLLGEELWGSDKTKNAKKPTARSARKQQAKRGKATGSASANGDEKKEGSSVGANKPYVWLHPPKNIELSPHDELFVLSDRNFMDSFKEDEMESRQFVDSSKVITNEEKKT